MFPFKNTDLTRFKKHAGEPRLASPKDPFMSMCSPQHYKPLHLVPVRPLATIIKQLRNDTRESGTKEIVDDITQIENRFYSGRQCTP